jgi:hypothetical protein
MYRFQSAPARKDKARAKSAYAPRNDGDNLTNPSDSLSGSLASILRSRSRESRASRPKSSVRFAPESETSAATGSSSRSLVDPPPAFEPGYGVGKSHDDEAPVRTTSEEFEEETGETLLEKSDETAASSGYRHWQHSKHDSQSRRVYY